MAKRVKVPEPVTVNIVSDHHHHRARLFEWMTALMMLGVAIVVAASPQTIERGGFAYLHEIGVSATVLTLIFGVAGVLRISGLYANGMWPVIGPRMRALGALVGSFIWLQMMYSLIIWSAKGGYLSIGVPVYAGLALGEFFACWRAATDVRRHH